MTPATLRLLIERARVASELAQARHAGLRRAEDQARAHLAMLRQYAAEYQDRGRARPGDSRDPSAADNQMLFLGRLQLAIDTQDLEVQGRVNAVAAAAQEVAARLRRQKSLETLDRRRVESERRTAAVRDQKETDEFAQRVRERNSNPHEASGQRSEP